MPTTAERDQLADALQRWMPGVSRAELERRAMAVRGQSAPHHHWAEAPQCLRAEDATTDVWRDLSATTAAAYVAAVLPVVRQARDAERRGLASQALPVLPAPTPFGDYDADRILGAGGDGVAFHARHRGTGQEVAIKQFARGDGFVRLHLDTDWHPNLVRIVDGKPLPPSQIGMLWVAREYGDETLHDVIRRRGVLPREEALAIFALCCEVVNWLHERHIVRWSAHAKNVLRFADTWKVADLGRSLIFVPSDHWTMKMQRLGLLEALGAEAEGTDPYVLDWLSQRWTTGHPTSAGFRLQDPDLERRHRMDDCAMLAGLLCVLLTGKRWAWFYRAVNRFPYCAAEYPLTGNTRTDRALSGVVNRAWRGDAGGALLMANGGRGEQTVYADASQLAADVSAALSAA